MNRTREVVVATVADVNRGRARYADQCGVAVDHDAAVGPDRVVQLSPPLSGCSVPGLPSVVGDIARARTQLVERGVEVSGIRSVDGAVQQISARR